LRHSLQLLWSYENDNYDVDHVRNLELPCDLRSVAWMVPCVKLLPDMWKAYNDRLLQESEIDQVFWRHKIKTEMAIRLRDSQTRDIISAENKKAWLE
jgi:hypothetical protein